MDKLPVLGFKECCLLLLLGKYNFKIVILDIIKYRSLCPTIYVTQINRIKLIYDVVAQLCVRSMAALETIDPMMNGMKKRPDTIGVACEALNRMFQKEQNDLVVQVSNFLLVF